MTTTPEEKAALLFNVQKLLRQHAKDTLDQCFENKVTWDVGDAGHHTLRLLVMVILAPASPSCEYSHSYLPVEHQYVTL